MYFPRAALPSPATPPSTSIPTSIPTSLPTSTSLPIIRPPLTHVTATDQTGIVAILTGFALGLLLLSILVRLYARRGAETLHSDDTAFYVAVGIGLAEVGLTLYLVSAGLGRSVELLSPAEAQVLRRGGLGAGLLYLTTLALSKGSCALMFLWLTPFKAQKRVAWGLIGAVWWVSALFVEGFGCRDVLGRCGGYMARWVYISVVDMLLELALVGSSVYMVWSRSMASRAKCTVVGAFAFRLPNVAITIARLVFLTTMSSTSAIHIARVQAATQLAVGYTVVACVIPYLRPLMQSYENDGTGNGRQDATFNLSDRSRGSRASRGSRGSKGSSSGSADVAEAKGKGKVIGAELHDVSRLLGPERPGFVRLKSTEAVERAMGQEV